MYIWIAVQVAGIHAYLIHIQLSRCSSIFYEKDLKVSVFLMLIQELAVPGVYVAVGICTIPFLLSRRLPHREANLILDRHQLRLEKIKAFRLDFYSKGPCKLLTSPPKVPQGNTSFTQSTTRCPCGLSGKDLTRHARLKGNARCRAWTCRAE